MIREFVVAVIVGLLVLLGIHLVQGLPFQPASALFFSLYLLLACLYLLVDLVLERRRVGAGL